MCWILDETIPGCYDSTPSSVCIETSQVFFVGDVVIVPAMQSDYDYQ